MRKKNVLSHAFHSRDAEYLIGNRVAVILAGERSSDFATVERVDDIDNDGAANASYGGDQLYWKPRSY